MVNVGTYDRLARLIIGIVMSAISLLPPGALALADLGLWRWAILAVGVVMIVTAAVRFCPIYALFGADTCGR